MKMFDEQVSKLQAARQLAWKFKQEVDESYEEWRAANGSIIACMEQAKMDLAEIEDQLRADIVLNYQESGDKKPHPKLGIRVSEVPQYNEGVAFSYALNTAPEELLMLDKRAFESYAKGQRNWDALQFVTWGEKVIATIAKDLSE
jgi:hypothetical protein